MVIIQSTFTVTLIKLHFVVKHVKHSSTTAPFALRDATRCYALLRAASRKMQLTKELFGSLVGSEGFPRRLDDGTGTTGTSQTTSGTTFVYPIKKAGLFCTR